MESDAIYVVTHSDYYYPLSGAGDVVGVFATLDDAEECYRDTETDRWSVAYVLEYEPGKAPVTVWCTDDQT